MPKPTKPDDAALLKLGHLMGSPVTFGTGLGKVRFAPHQVRALNTILREPKSAFVKCNASGFTFTLAWLAVWWLIRYEDSVVFYTSATGRQVERQLGKEVRNAIRSSGVNLPEPNLTSILIVDPVTGNERIMEGISTNDPHALRGWRGKHVLGLVDEATQLPDDQWLALDMAPAGGHVRLVATSNATNPTSRFAAICRGQAAGWYHERISCWDTPNFEGIDLAALLAMPTDKGGPLDDNAWPELTTRRWARELWDDPRFSEEQFRMLAEAVFMEQSENALIPWAWLERADRPHCGMAGPIRIGVDPGGGGAETGIVVASGASILSIKGLRSEDDRGAASAHCNQWKDHNPTICVDKLGLGHYFVAHLRDQGFKVVPVNVSLPANDTERFMNTNIEMAWGVRELFEADAVSGLTCSILRGQAATMEYGYDPRGRYRLMPKPSPSPDRWDALKLALADTRQRTRLECEGDEVYVTDVARDEDDEIELRGGAAVRGQDW